MRTRTGLWTCAVLLLTAAASPTQAAWCNVFQACCWHKHKCACAPAPVTAAYYYAPPAATSCYAAASPCCDSCSQQSCYPQTCCQSCQTYQARCYYEPVTCYQSKTYYEPVTSYRTSYYYEPCTSYRTSYYYDPCNCGYVARSCPVTSYSLKAQVCPVQSWVQRCAQVPVTTYRQSFYWEAVPSCSCAPPCSCPSGPSCPTCQGAAPCSSCPSSQPGVAVTPGAPQPGVSVTPGAPSQPGVNVYPSNLPTGAAPAGATDPGSRQARPLGEGNNPSSASPGVRLDRVVALPTATIEGQVVSADYAPRADALVVFKNADRQGCEERVTANSVGEFRATLASGTWQVYVKNRDGQLQLQKEIRVGEKAQLVTLLAK